MSRGGWRWDNQITLKQATIDVENFEWLLDQGETYEGACRRLGLHARTMLRRYEQVGQPHPPGLAATATTMRKPRVAS